MRRRDLVLLSAASTALVAGVIGCASDYTKPSGTIPTPVADGKPCVEANNIPVATTPPGTDATGSSLPVGTVPKPHVSMPVGPPPTELKTVDIKVGDGAEAKIGDNVTMNYVGVACSTGKQFDSSFDSGEPFTTTLQEGSVIKGWVEGVKGMKVGGQRQLIIPPALAYGDNPPGDDILPGETLVFVVDLIKAETPPPTTTTTAPPAGATTTAPASESPASTATTAAPAQSTTTAPPAQK